MYAVSSELLQPLLSLNLKIMNLAINNFLWNVDSDKSGQNLLVEPSIS